MGPRTGVDGLERRKFFLPPGLEIRTLGSPSRSQSRYRNLKKLRGFLVRKRTIPTERPQPAGEVSANFS
jgi:hypothetical protein